MTWVYLDLITLNRQSLWEFSDVFPPETQVIKFTQSMILQGTVIPPENAKIRGLLSFAQVNELLGNYEILESKVIYPSNYQIIYHVPPHPFTQPKLALKLLSNMYAKYDPLWAFNIYYWQGEVNGTDTGINSTELSNLINNLGVGGGYIPPQLI